MLLLIKIRLVLKNLVSNSFSRQSTYFLLVLQATTCHPYFIHILQFQLHFLSSLNHIFLFVLSRFTRIFSLSFFSICTLLSTFFCSVFSQTWFFVFMFVQWFLRLFLNIGWQRFAFFASLCWYWPHFTFVKNTVFTLLLNIPLQLVLPSRSTSLEWSSYYLYYLRVYIYFICQNLPVFYIVY